MTAAGVLGCAWVLVAIGTVLLPLNRQMRPDFGLVPTAPPVVGWLGMGRGAWAASLPSAAVPLTFRRSLAALVTQGRVA
ncbi:DUF2484 family protein [Rubellimicrobium rubrum]|uniref:DUF2484 family protein n=1 Tax=Rubellimicrobium rubrum TaxID=2585369 RepID=A0A5C4N5M3_9RHOB|nr:DUF2484 family protein [Rubellimicrobium rubrum]